MQDKADRNTEKCLERWIATQRQLLEQAEASGFLGMDAEIQAKGKRSILAALNTWLRERRRARAMV